MRLFLANLKMLFRNRQLLFWSLAFPLIFTGIFGLFFGSDIQAGKVVLVNDGQSELASSLEENLNETDLFTVRKEASVETAKTILNKDEASSVIIIPETFGRTDEGADKTIRVLYDPASQQSAAIVVVFINQYLTEVNYRLQNAQPIFTVQQEVATNGSFNYFDFVLIGLIGMALMNSNIQGLAIAMSRYREDKILKRITTTPLPAWKFILAEVLSHLVLNIVQVGVIMAIGVYVFKGNLGGHILLLVSLALLGAVLFQLIGFLIASATKTASAAEGMSTAVTIPMMFLSGVFFPIDQLPKWLFSIVQYLPLSPLLRLMREGALENVSPFSDPKYLAIVAVWIVVTFLFVVWRFRLSEE